MKGNNTIILNEASMIVAIQYYFEKQVFSDCPVVKSVKYDQLKGTFTVLLGDKEDPK